MKKLMIAACAVVLAAATQAATYNWNVMTGTGQGLTAPTSVGTTGTAYLFLGENVDASEMWADILANDGSTWSTWAAQAEGTFSLNNGMVVNDSGKNYARVQTESDTKAQTLYTVFKDGDNYFFDIYNELSGSTADSGAAYTLDMSYAADYSYGKVAWQGESDTGGAGWYSTAAAPEPTSGLLLLIGMAGLALRRRRA